MNTHRLTRTVAAALAIAAVAAPTAVARPADAGPAWKLPDGFQTADTRDAGSYRGTYEPVPPEGQPQQAQDLRNPDTVDFANGRGTYNSPEVVVVAAPRPVPQPTADGLDWADVGLGAGSLMGLSLIALGAGLVVLHRRGARQLAG